jgi:hypothetical protein
MSMKGWFGRVLAIAVTIAPPTAQAGQPRGYWRATADAVLSSRVTAVEQAPTQLAFVVDSVCTIGLGEHVTLVARPLAWRSRGSEWTGRLVQLGVRYERAARLGLRVDAGFLAPPVGLAALELRADVNPTVRPALSDQVLPAVDPAGPALSLYALTYPLGVQAAVSGPVWDARAALVDSSPLRTRMPFVSGGPARAPQWMAGGGVTPRAGLRVGGWWAHGPYARAEELGGTGRTDRRATLGGVETEYAFAHTRLAGEVIAARLETSAGRRTARGWMIEGTQTVTPRWFVAGRWRSTEAPRGATASTPADGSYAGSRACASECVADAGKDAYAHETADPGPRLAISSSPTGSPRRHTVGEATVGYRLSPALTVRAGLVGQRRYDERRWQPGGAISVVWSRRLF